MGDPASMDTLIDYWSAMEELHYPYAGQMRDRLMERQRKMAAAQMQAAIAVQNQQQMQPEVPAAGG